MHETLVDSKLMLTFASQNKKMVSIAQLVRASDCGSEGRGFETLCSPYLISVSYTHLRAHET